MSDEVQRHSRANPCAICDGHQSNPRGSGTRCHGFTTDTWVQCSREDYAGRLNPNDAGLYAHCVDGKKCPCGQVHGTPSTNHGPWDSQARADVQPIGRAKRASIEAEYSYQTPDGKLAFQVVRFTGKDFRQRRKLDDGSWEWKVKGTRLYPYHLPEVISGVAAGDTIYIAEGEKDVEALRSHKLVATCNPGGAKKWLPEFSEWFNGAHVVMVRDKDEDGKEHARRVWGCLKDVVASFRVVESREGKDASDHLKAGYKAEDLRIVWPLEELRHADPAEWKRIVFCQCLDPGEAFAWSTIDEGMQLPAAPMIPVGLQRAASAATAFGEESVWLEHIRGVTMISGEPSCWKSWLAISIVGSGVENNWHGIYVSAEMSTAILSRRFHGRVGPAFRDGVDILEARYGATVESLVEQISEKLDNRRTLIVIDSVSSFLDLCPQQSETDTFKMGPLSHLVMWAMQVRLRTEGEVAIILLSETNAQGRMKGRFGDHRADIGLSLRKNEEHPRLRDLHIVKSWEGHTGRVGAFSLNPSSCQLIKMGD